MIILWVVGPVSGSPHAMRKERYFCK